MDGSNPLHASCVAVGERAVLLTGASGAGKSSLALQLMGYGATLVADDRVLLTQEDGAVMASCPANLSGLIEARGIGVLHADTQTQARVCLVVNLDKTETERIPPRRSVTLLGCEIPLLHRVDGIHLAPALLQWLHTGRSER